MKKRIFAAIIAAVFVVLNIASALPAIALDESTTKYEKAESNVSETVETKGVLMGDADQNGVIVINDALVIMRTALRLENREPESCDVNGDGLLTMADALLILRVSLHLSDAFYLIERLTEFEAVDYCFPVKTEMECTFVVKADGNVGKVELCDKNGSVVGAMHDDGQYGDSTANDRIYSIVIPVIENIACSECYFARCGQIQSNDSEIYFILTPTQESIEEAQNVIEEINRIESNYLDSSGFISESSIESVINTVSEYAEAKVNEGTLLFSKTDNDSVFLKFACGLPYVYSPTTMNFDSTGNETELTVITCQPFLDTYSNDLREYMALPDSAAQAAAETFDHVFFNSTTNFDNGRVTLDRIKNLGSNQIILWHGHGGYSAKLHSFILTGEDFDWNAWFWDTTGYWWDCVCDRIINTSGRVAFTSKFVDKYCGNLNNDLIYMATCHSGADRILADSFLNKGARAYVGNTNVIYTEYNLVIMRAIVTRMTEISHSSHNYYTLSEALVAAKEMHGDNDVEYAHMQNWNNIKPNAATPIIYGGESAYNYRLGNNSENSGSITGKVCKASDHVTPISGADIKVYAGNSLIKSTLSNASGNYELQLPAGDYRVNISADGYIAFSSYVTVNADENFYMETFLLVEGSEEDNGTASGYITNALTGSGVSDVSITVRNGWNNTCIGSIVTTASTNGSGAYSLELPLGNYTLALDKDGFISTHINIVVQNGITSNQNGSISPILDATGTYRIVLTWGENPDDLDSHVEGTLSNGNHFHVYYSHQSQYDGSIEVCNLDVDDTTSYGPETITLIPTTTDPYYYYIHHYAGSGSIASSEAKIRLYQGETMIAEFNAPANQGTDLYWNVFAIVNGELVVRNTITSYADVSYAD